MAFLQIPQEFANKSTDQIVAEAGSGAMPLIEAGNYPAVIVGSEMKSTQTGGQMLVLKVVLTQGKYANTEFLDRLNVINSNPVAVKIAYETLAKVAKAVGLATIPADSSQLHNKPFLVEIKTEAGQPFKDKTTGEQRMGKDKSVIAGYAPAQQIGVAGMGAQPAVGGNALPWANK